MIPTPMAPLEEPILAGTPVPQPVMVISPESADQVTRLARWGKGRVNEVAYATDGSLLAVASSLGIYLYDAETWEALRLIETDTWVASVAFSPDGTLVAANGYWTVRLWDVVTGQEVRTFRHTPHEVNSIAFSPDGETLAAGWSDGTVVLWVIATEP